MSCTTQDQGISRIIALWHDQTVRQVQRTGVKRISESGEPSSMESHPTKQQLGFPGGSDGEESGCNAGDLDLIPGLGRFPGGGHSNLLQYSWLENSHGQRSLEGDSPWGCKESDTTDWLSTQIATPVVSLFSHRNLTSWGWAVRGTRSLPGVERAFADDPGLVRNLLSLFQCRERMTCTWSSYSHSSSL